MDLFHSLYNAPKRAVVALECSQNKVVYILYTTNLYTFLLRTIDSLHHNSFFLPDIQNNAQDAQFSILEDVSDYDNPIIGHYLAHKWAESYRIDMGYTLLATPHACVLKPIVDISMVEHHGMCVSLTLVDKRSKRYLIGSFDTVAEADAYVSSNSIEDMLKYALKNKDVPMKYLRMPRV